jgi:hypothetical protein
MPDKPRKPKKTKKPDDVMHGRDFAGESFAANEEEQTRERERAGHDRTDEVGEITETERDEDW